MGLDVYLYELKEGVTPEEFAAARKRREDAEEAFYSRDDYKSLTDEQKDEIRTALPPDPEGEFNFKTNLIQPREGLLARQIELPHPKYPEHLFKIGYWRSSYNSGGINHVLEDLGLPTLYWVAAGEDGESDLQEYCCFLDWPQVLVRATELRQRYEVRKAETGNAFVVEEKLNPFRSPEHQDVPRSASQAMDIYIKERKRSAEFRSKFPDPEHSGDYSNISGTFFMSGTTRLLALIPGTRTPILRTEPPAPECLYAIVQSTDPVDNFYGEALEIVEATARHCVESGHPERFYVHWSG